MTSMKSLESLRFSAFKGVQKCNIGNKRVKKTESFPLHASNSKVIFWGIAFNYYLKLNLFQANVPFHIPLGKSLVF